MDLPAGMRALGHRNFRLYFTGQAISILGSWIQQVALSWLVYRLTGSAALFGSSQFGFDMWASAAVSYTHDGSGRPMAWVILVTTALSLAGYLLFRRASR